MKRKILYLCILFTLFIIVYLYQPRELKKCPDDYPTTDAGSAAYLKDFDEWTNTFFDTHTGATLRDWSNARHQFWVDNNCIEVLKRYEEAQSGNADPTTMKRIEDTVKKEIDRYNQNL